MSTTIYLLHSKNQLIVDNKIIQCKRQWTIFLIHLLANQSKQYPEVNIDNLHTELAKLSHTTHLSRQQISRIISDVEQALNQIPNQPVRLDYLPRKMTVGPWQFTYHTPTCFQVIKSPQDIPTNAFKIAQSQCTFISNQSTTVTASPSGAQQITLLNNIHIGSLHQLLTDLLISDGFAQEGDFLSALETIEPCFKHDISTDMRSLLLLRCATYDKNIGNYQAARQYIFDLLKQPDKNFNDITLKDHARFFLDRIAYDECPATAYQQLLQNESPPLKFSVNPRISAEWHNLRALLIRRKLLEYSEQNSAEQLNLHHSAIRHFEIALYWALSFKDFSHIQSYVGNLAFHLHKTMHLGYADVHTVFNWYNLFMNYTEKLDTGKDSAWEYIFLGEFWLDYEHQLTNHNSKIDTRLTLDNNLHPKDERFYHYAIQRLNNCADYRQVGIAWINYKRYAQRHLHPSSLKSINTKLKELLKDNQLQKQLVSDGYESYL